jgi:transcriptional regulator with XRE-family HTH domain
VNLKYSKRLPTFLRELREEAGLSQYEMADVLGVSQGKVSRLEKDGANVSPAMVERYLEHFGKHPMDLVLWLLDALSEEDHAELALRALGFQAPEAMPARIRDLAVQGLVHQRRTLQALLAGLEPDAKDLEEVLEELEMLATSSPGGQ